MEWLLILLPFGVVLATGIAFIFLSARLAASAPASLRRTETRFGEQNYVQLDHYRSILLQHPLRWLAIRNPGLAKIQQALRLSHPSSCSWTEALPHLGDHKVFISPPVQGWVLVFGQDLPDPADDVDCCFHFLRHLSHSLGEVQFFGAHRAVNHHSWVRLDQGRVLRAYAWAGETLWNQGEITAAERELNVKCIGYGEAEPHGLPALSDPDQPNADKVNLLAARWSIDPAAVINPTTLQSLGISGILSRLKIRES